MASISIGPLPSSRNPVHATGTEADSPRAVCANSANSVIHFDPAGWETAVRRVAETELAAGQFYLANVAPIADAHSKGLATIADVLAAEKSVDPYGTARADAINNLTVTPAPTLAGIKLKIEIAHKDGLFDGGKSSDSAIEAILSDLRRLLGDA